MFMIPSVAVIFLDITYNAAFELAIFYMSQTGDLFRSEIPFIFKAWFGHIKIALSIRSLICQ